MESLDRSKEIRSFFIPRVCPLENRIIKSVLCRLYGADIIVYIGYDKFKIMYNEGDSKHFILGSPESPNDNYSEGKAANMLLSILSKGSPEYIFIDTIVKSGLLGVSNIIDLYLNDHKIYYALITNNEIWSGNWNNFKNIALPNEKYLTYIKILSLLCISIGKIDPTKLLRDTPLGPLITTIDGLKVISSVHVDNEIIKPIMFSGKCDILITNSKFNGNDMYDSQFLYIVNNGDDYKHSILLEALRDLRMCEGASLLDDNTKDSLILNTSIVAYDIIRDICSSYIKLLENKNLKITKELEKPKYITYNLICNISKYFINLFRGTK